MADMVTPGEPRQGTSETKTEVQAVQSANTSPLKTEDFRPRFRPKSLHKIRRSYVAPSDRSAIIQNQFPIAVPNFVQWTRMYQELQWTRMCAALGKFLPHLQNVFEKALNPRLGRLHVYNLRNIDHQQLIFSDTLWEGRDGGFKDLLRSDFPTEVSTRLIVVEDLSSLVMLTLGQSLHVSPEVFEEHLIRSRYGQFWVDTESNRFPSLDDHGPGSNLEPRHWNTASLQKVHLSLWWWRPVHLLKHEMENQAFPGMSNIIRRHCPGGVFSKNYGMYRHQAVPGNIWEERVTILRCETGLGSHLLVIIDPLPYVFSDDVPGQGPHPEEETRVHVQVPFTQPVPRLPPLDGPVSTHQACINGAQYDRYFCQTSSTAESLEAWISFHNRRGHGPNYRRAVPLLSLLSIISSDTHGLLSGIQLTVQGINEMIISDPKISLDFMRSGLNFFTAELPSLKIRLAEFIEYCLPNEDIPPALQSELDNLLTDLEAMIQQCDKLQQALRVELTIMASKRAILEAETVTGLTQLAFVFIPLTFAAGLFSINVREFVQPPSITSFIITCVVLLVATYGVRALRRFIPLFIYPFYSLRSRLSPRLWNTRVGFRRWREKHNISWQHFMSCLFWPLLAISPPRTRRWLEKLAPSLGFRIQARKITRTEDA